MLLVVHDIKIKIEQDDSAAYPDVVAPLLKLRPEEIVVDSILSKSLDRRDPEQFYYKLLLVVQTPAWYQNPKRYKKFKKESFCRPAYKNIKDLRPIIIGFGPAGMFAAIECIKNGVKPVVFERGKRVEERSEDVKRFIDEKKLDTESNIQFGEGGAGTFSDGKIFSRRNRNVSYVGRVLDTLIEFGAPADIAYREKPHLGTDVLCVIVRNVRNFILEHGGQIHFGSRVTDLLVEDQKVVGVVINGEDEFTASHVLLGVGHSARDTCEMLYEKGVLLEQRNILMGLRIEHRAETINQFRYGRKYQRYHELGAATYSINYTDKKTGTGAYTFCMCPGGVIVNAASEDKCLVVNGMSYSDRGLSHSNAAIVVPCRQQRYPDTTPLAGIKLQRQIENDAFIAGGKSWKAPVQSLYNFLGFSNDTLLPLDSSYQMGLNVCDIREYLPAFITDQLAAAFKYWKDKYPPFIAEEALLIGAETRTSSPVRIVRNKRMESVNVKNLYPIGEGAGYTGGITSSAADGIKAVDIIMQQYL